MSKTRLITTPLLLLLAIRLNGQSYDKPTQGLTLGYYNDKFGSHGLRVGYEKPVWMKFRNTTEKPSVKHTWMVKANLNFYNHQRHHTGVSAVATFGYRYTSKAGFIVEPLHVGTGYLRSFLSGETYEINPDGGFREVKWDGNSTFILPYLQLIGLGYDFRQKGTLPLSFQMSIDPYFQHSVNTQTKIRLASPITITYYFK